MDDQELLRRYAHEGSEDAFRQLVERHGGLVYGVSLRQLGRPHQAEEIAHAVFAALARKAASLAPQTVLVGWLFRATRFAAAKFQRDEGRRQRREQEAAMMMNDQSAPEPELAWEQIMPLLDAELESLGDKDRSAILLRFFENRSFKEVGAALGASEDTAKMRVSRALEKLRRRFIKRGVALSAAAFASAFGSEALAAGATAPPGLAASVATCCAAKGGSNALVEALVRKLGWWKWKPVLMGITTAAVVMLIVFASYRSLNAPTPPPATTPAWPAQR